ncbi:MAG TPA: hypothetical protein VK796_09765 [Cytophaga sp.]|jgi:hypothetical protein|nr:hypothetical protein [Cytophaga sp.]
MHKFIISILITVITLGCNESNHEKDHESKSEISNSKHDIFPTYTKETYADYVKLQGKWIEEKDANYSFEFNKNKFIEKSGEAINESEYILLQNCDNSANINEEESFTFVGFQMEDSNETHCIFEIISLSEKTLSIMYVENGHILVFNKQ